MTNQLTGPQAIKKRGLNSTLTSSRLLKLVRETSDSITVTKKNIRSDDIFNVIIFELIQRVYMYSSILYIRLTYQKHMSKKYNQLYMNLCGRIKKQG